MHSSYCIEILEGLGSGYRMAPQSWKDLLSRLLSPAQYVVWDSEYQQYAIQHGNNSGGLYIPDQLYGAGQFNTIQAQAVNIPPQAYPIIVVCVMKAYRKVEEIGRPQKSFSVIKQGPTEPYPDYIDKLQEAIKRQIANPKAAEELLLKLAFENANADCKKALTSVIARPGYTLAEMLRACAAVGTTTWQMDTLAAALQKGHFEKPKGNCFSWWW